MLMFIEEIKRYKTDIEKLIEYEEKELNEEEKKEYEKLRISLSKKMRISRLKLAIIEWLESFTLDEIKEKFNYKITNEYKPSTYRKWTVGKTIKYSYVESGIYYVIYLPKHEVMKAFMKEVIKEG